MKIGIIGGTGFYAPGALENEREETVDTPFGQARLICGEYGGRQVVFLPRHGAHHTLPPHLINYRGNIWALRQAGVSKVLATAAVGSLRRELGPGGIVLVDQFLDFTHNRIQTFYEGGENGVLHTDMTNPYCPQLNRDVAAVAGRQQIDLHLGATYVCTDGPRYETPAEIRMFSMLGGDLVGMTSVPEVVLAREAGLCYATLALVTNFAAGISDHPLSHLEVVAEMERTQAVLRRLIFAAVEQLPEERQCGCSRAADELGSLGKSH